MPGSLAPDMQCGSLDDDEVREVKANTSSRYITSSSLTRNPYSRWGGLPASLGSCEDLEAEKRRDPSLWLLLSKLDVLERAGNSQASISDAFVTSGITALDVDRLNSPLLDGLWLALTGNEPSPTAGFTLAPCATLAHTLFRVIFNRRQFTETVRFLLQRGAGEGRAAENGLFAALSTGHMDIADLLLELNPNINSRPGVALGSALKAKDERMVLKLLKLGAIVPKIALSLAVQNGMSSAVEALLAIWMNEKTTLARVDASAQRFDQHANPWLARDNVLFDALLAAVKAGKLEIVNVFLERGATPTAVGVSACLVEACARADTAMLRLLLRLFANAVASGPSRAVDTRNLFKAIQVTVSKEHLECMQILLSGIENISVHQSCLETALTEQPPSATRRPCDG